MKEGGGQIDPPQEKLPLRGPALLGLRYPFKQNKYMLKNMKVRLYTYFYNISLNVLRPNFFNMYNLPFSLFSNNVEIRTNLGQKLTTFPTL